MNDKKIFPFRVKESSYQEMRKILRFPEVTGPEIDGQVCRVTVTNYAPDLSIKREFLEQYRKDNVFQIRLLENNDREFVVMSSMLEHLNEPVILH